MLSLMSLARSLFEMSPERFLMISCLQTTEYLFIERVWDGDMTRIRFRTFANN
jgi:hypothetical protein